MQYNSVFRKSGIAFLAAILFSLDCVQSSEKDYPIQPVPFTEVKMIDDFWQARMETNRAVTIRHAFKKNEETGKIENFAVAGGLSKGEQKGDYPFDDTDVFKTLEGASYALMVNPDPELEVYLDSVIAVVAAAQEEVSSVQVYWFDDTGMGERRIPESWRVLYLEDEEWRPVYSPAPYPIRKDQFNEILFETVHTKSLRLEIQSQEGWAGGIHEWKVK